MEWKLIVLIAFLGAAGLLLYFLLRKSRKFPYLTENVPTPRNVYLKIHQKKRKNGEDTNIQS